MQVHPRSVHGYMLLDSQTPHAPSPHHDDGCTAFLNNCAVAFFEEAHEVATGAGLARCTREQQHRQQQQWGGRGGAVVIIRVLACWPQHPVSTTSTTTHNSHGQTGACGLQVARLPSHRQQRQLRTRQCRADSECVGPSVHLCRGVEMEIACTKEQTAKTEAPTEQTVH